MIPGPQTSLTLKTKTETTDSAGSYTITWATVQTISGVLTQARGRESEKYIYARDSVGRLVAYSTHVFFCEEPSSITAEDQFTYGTRTFEIVAIREPGNMNHHLEIDLLEIV